MRAIGVALLTIAVCVGGCARKAEDVQASGVLFRPGTDGAPPQFIGGKPIVVGPGRAKAIYNLPGG